VRRLEALWLWRLEPARPGLDPVLHQDQDCDRALAVGNQGRLGVRHPDDEVSALRPAWAVPVMASGAIRVQAMTAPTNSTAAPPPRTLASANPARIESVSAGSCPARIANRAPSPATPRVAPTIRAVLTTPDAAPA